MRDDCVIDYKNQNMGLALDAVFPNGIDLYFYNVGGPLVDNVLGRFRRRARVVTTNRFTLNVLKRSLTEYGMVL